MKSICGDAISLHLSQKWAQVTPSIYMRTKDLLSEVFDIKKNMACSAYARVRPRS